ncbi:TetR/AcrR family transcriptional regulator [Actinomadura rugatobispora]|uniref:TetR/AcrR family transcriptional regulator n=1 Tax=Actinomadura rugatobispora TaxID=1994 RepID=A0ABW0ZMD8_9ACTN|nr:TetR/AcrR family transcriptional regulator [Actinomadura rugatobispora]
MGTSGRRVGRPRAAQRPDSGLPAREELLAAAAEMFTERGYAATSTRAIAERAGMRQATMYHYFDGKEDLLAALLEGTVTPSLRLARGLLADDGPAPAEARLWQLCRSDVELLCGGPHNLGALYLLPEVRAEQFAGFHRVRAELKETYGQLLAATESCGALDKRELVLRTDLVFGLIESVILIHRSGPERPVPVFAAATADAALRVAGVREEDLAAAREAGRNLA